MTNHRISKIIEKFRNDQPSKDDSVFIHDGPYSVHENLEITIRKWTKFKQTYRFTSTKLNN